MCLRFACDHIMPCLAAQKASQAASASAIKLIEHTRRDPMCILLIAAAAVEGAN
jgi:hypothetical protein